MYSLVRTVSNELPISAEILEDLLCQDAEHRFYINDPEHEVHVRVATGLDPDARIIGASFDRFLRAVVLIYDREVPDFLILQERRP